MKHGIIKNTNNGWVIEYSEFIDNLFDAEKPINVSGPKRRTNRGNIFQTLAIPVNRNSWSLCVEGDKVEFNIEDGLAEIIPYVPKPHSDMLIGWLVGEIIWCRKIMMFTENSLIETMVTPEEKAEYQRLDNVWFAGGRYGKGNVDEATHKQDWKNFRTYARALHIKYMPHEIEYREFVQYDITDVEAFAKGIMKFLWDTDHCCYTFTKEDITLERRVGMDSNLFKIKFKLDYLVESNN